MEIITAEKYRELFKLRAEGRLDVMQCTKSLYRILEDLYFDGIKILDIPCGVGHYFRKIRELGNIDYMGVDLDSQAIEMAKEIWKDAVNAKFCVKDVSSFELEDNSFDIVYCYNLLLHLKNYKEPLKNLFRVSKRYIIVRSLFDKEECMNLIEVADDYLNVYQSGKAYYNTYARGDIRNFVKSLGPSKVRFVPDNSSIPQESVEKQMNSLNVRKSEFSIGARSCKESWKGLSLNYEVLIIEKEKETNK